MKKNINNIFINIISNAIYQLIFWLFLAIGMPAVATITLLKEAHGDNISSKWWLLLTLFVLLSLGNIVIGILQFVRVRSRPVFPSIKSDMYYEISKTELHFVDRENIKCYREVNFKILCDKMKYIRKQFTWTGDGYKGTFLDEERSLCKNFIIDDSIRKLPPQIYDVEFDSEKKKGDWVSYCVRSEVEDKGHVMQPFLQQIVKNKTQKLELVLTVPRGMVKNVRSCVTADSSGKVQIGDREEITKKSYGDYEAYEFVIKKPELLHIYRIDWEWNKIDKT